jgi:outer membrane murein-binding lipoprotein Lpp
MALTRKMLKAMGVEEEKIDQIIEAHTETTESLKAERDKYKESAEKVSDLQSQLEKANEQIKAAGDDGYKAKYEAIKEEFEGFKKDIETQKTAKMKSEAYEKLLKDAGVSEKRIATVLKVSDLSAIEIDKDGNLKDADKLTENIKAEWSDFIQTQEQQGADVPNPPSNNGGSVDLGSLSMEDYIKARQNS